MKNLWQRKLIGEVCEVVNGGTPSTKVPEYWGGKHLWITPAEMGKRAMPYVDDTERKLTDSGLLDSSARLLPPYSIILSSRAPIGHLVINTKPMSTNQGCKGLIPKKQLEHKFLYYYLSSIVDFLDGLGSGATFRELSGGKLREVPVPIPPLPEQKRVVEVLDRALDGFATAIANTEKNLENSRRLFESKLQSVFDQPGSEWEKKTLGEVYDVRDGTHDSPKYHPTGFPLITSKNLKRDGLSFEDVSLINARDYAKINERSAVHKGDVLFAMIGTIGNPTLVTVEPNFAIKNVALFKIPKNQSGGFLKHYLASGWVTSKMLQEARGATQKFVGLGYLRGFPIKVPPLTKQLEVQDQLDNLSSETQRLENLYEQKLAELDALKASVLHHACNGYL